MVKGVPYLLYSWNKNEKEEWLTRTGRLIIWYASSEKLNAATFQYEMHSGLTVGQYLCYNILQKLRFYDLRQSFHWALNNKKINFADILNFGKKIFSWSMTVLHCTELCVLSLPLELNVMYRTGFYKCASLIECTSHS